MSNEQHGEPALALPLRVVAGFDGLVFYDMNEEPVELFEILAAVNESAALRAELAKAEEESAKRLWASEALKLAEIELAAARAQVTKLESKINQVYESGNTAIAEMGRLVQETVHERDEARAQVATLREAGNRLRESVYVLAGMFGWPEWVSPGWKEKIQSAFDGWVKLEAALAATEPEPTAGKDT